MLKILQARLQWYVNQELPDVQAGFRKAEEPEIKLPTSPGSQKKQENPRKNIYFCFVDYTKAFDRVDHNKLWKILKELGIPDPLTCLLRNLYARQEATVRTGHGTTEWFQIRKEYFKAVYCHPDYLSYMQKTSCKLPGWMKHTQAGIKTSRRNINNLRYADDTTLMAESVEELKTLSRTVKKESEKAGLKLNIQKLRSWHPVPSLNGK